MKEQVKHPEHYNSSINGLETIDVMEGAVNVKDTVKSGFRKMTAVKYICRAGLKDDRIKDINKAIEYLQMLVEYWESKEEDRYVSHND